MAHRPDRTPSGVPADVTRVLTLVGDALVAFDRDALVAAEPELADLAAQLSQLTSLTAAQREALQPMLEQARAALARCERLGARLASLAGETYAVAAPAYERGGRPQPRAAAQMEAKA